MHTEMMSSEDSLEENDEEVLKIRPLTWRAKIVNKMFAELDVMSKKEKPSSKKAAETKEDWGGIYKTPPSLASAWNLARPWGTWIWLELGYT